MIYYISEMWYTDRESAQLGFKSFGHLLRGSGETGNLSAVLIITTILFIKDLQVLGGQFHMWCNTHAHSYVRIVKWLSQTVMGGRLSAEDWLRRSEKRNMNEQRGEEKTRLEEQRRSVPHGLVIQTLHCCCCCTGDKFLHSRGAIITSTHFCPVSRSP